MSDKKGGNLNGSEILIPEPPKDGGSDGAESVNNPPEIKSDAELLDNIPDISGDLEKQIRKGAESEKKQDEIDKKNGTLYSQEDEEEEKKSKENSLDKSLVIVGAIVLLSIGVSYAYYMRKRGELDREVADAFINGYKREVKVDEKGFIDG